MKTKSRKQLDAENAAAKRYYHSERGRAVIAAYHASARFKAQRAAYRETARYKAYRESPEYKARRRAYLSRPENLARRRAHSKRYYATAKGQESLRRERLRRLTRPQSCFALYRHNARNRKIAFALTFEQFMTFWRQACAC